MPRLFRAMCRVGNKPLVAPTARGLGVRRGVDIVVDGSGDVSPGSGGMSVAPDWRLLPPWRIPRRLAQIVPQAHGRNDDACWRFGQNGFVTELIGEHLRFVPDRPSHGLVEPAYEMPLGSYETALADTQDHWIIDES
jgi:hypothetical protein